MAGGSVEFSASCTPAIFPRVLAIDGISLEAQLAGTILYLRNHDEPGVIGQVGGTLGKLGVNIDDLLTRVRTQCQISQWDKELDVAISSKA